MLVPMTTSVDFVTPLNVDGGIFPEIVIDADNPAKAFEPTDVIDADCIVIFDKDEQFWNADWPMVVTFAGIIIDVSWEHPWNADSPMVLTFDGIIIDVSWEQFSNVDSPIFVILFGMLIERSPLKFENA